MRLGRDHNIQQLDNGEIVEVINGVAYRLPQGNGGGGGCQLRSTALVILCILVIMLAIFMMLDGEKDAQYFSTPVPGGGSGETIPVWEPPTPAQMNEAILPDGYPEVSSGIQFLDDFSDLPEVANVSNNIYLFAVNPGQPIAQLE